MRRRKKIFPRQLINRYGGDGVRGSIACCDHVGMGSNPIRHPERNRYIYGIDMDQDKYLKFLDSLTKLKVADHSIVALLMEEFPKLGITGAMLIVEYWQSVSYLAAIGPEETDDVVED